MISGNAAIRDHALKVAWTDMDGHHAFQSRPDRVRRILVRDPDGYIVEINDAPHPAV